MWTAPAETSLITKTARPAADRSNSWYASMTGAILQAARPAGKMSKAYIPIPCSIYSGYELAILRGEALRVAWRGARGIDRIEHLKPVDLRTRSGGEYMIARNRLGQRRVMRLDRIMNAEALRSDA
jgi:Rho-binding antiterminator